MIALALIPVAFMLVVSALLLLAAATNPLFEERRRSTAAWAIIGLLLNGLSAFTIIKELLA